MSCRAQSQSRSKIWLTTISQDGWIPNPMAFPFLSFESRQRETASSFSLAPERVCGAGVVGEADSVPRIQQLAGPSCRAFLAARWDELNLPASRLGCIEARGKCRRSRAVPDGAPSATFDSSCAFRCSRLRQPALGDRAEVTETLSGSKTLQVTLDPSRRPAHSLFIPPLPRDM